MYQLKNAKPDNEIKQQLALDYYLQNEKNNGINLFKNMSLRAINNADFNNQTLAFLDPNYGGMLSNLQMAYHSDCVFITLHEEKTIVAHTLLTLRENVAYVSEIIVPDKKNFIPYIESETLTPAYLMYNVILEYIDLEIIKNNLDITKIVFMGDFDDLNHTIALLALGYELKTTAKKNSKCYVKEITREVRSARNLIN